jgi:hypothetical protein
MPTPVCSFLLAKDGRTLAEAPPMGFLKQFPLLPVDFVLAGSHEEATT